MSSGVWVCSGLESLARVTGLVLAVFGFRALKTFRYEPGRLRGAKHVTKMVLVSNAQSYRCEWLKHGWEKGGASHTIAFASRNVQRL